MDGRLVGVVVNGVQVPMLTSRSYLKDSLTYSALSSGVLGRWHPVGGGGEGDFDSVGECVPSLYRSVYGDREGKENGSFDDFRTDRLGYGGGDLDEAGEGVLGRHRPVRAREGGGGEMVPSTG